MPKKIIYNPNCAKCMFRSNRPKVNVCDYLYLTSYRRVCPVEDCTKFIEGERLTAPLPRALTRTTPEDVIMAAYSCVTKNRLAAMTETVTTYATKGR